MGLFSRMENKMEDTIEGVADKMVSAPISPVQIAKQCEKQMKRNKMVGAGKQIAPTLYTVLVNEDDDHRLFGYYPTLSGETETFLTARAHDAGLSLDGKPLVRFIADPALKHGKFDVIAECVASPIIARLRDEEMARYGFNAHASTPRNAYQAAYENAYDEYTSEPPVEPLISSSAQNAAAAASAQPLHLPQAQPLHATLTDKATGESYSLSAANIQLGRESDNDIIIADMGASRYHAAITRGQNCWILSDQNSTNGTLVNGQEIDSVTLRNGDTITIGTTDYLFAQQ